MLRRLLLLLLLTTPLAAMASPAILIFGDSLSAGHGIALERGWPALLARRLEDQRLAYRVVNASISGETTAGGRARFADALERAQPSVVVIALGANDGLRGLPIAQMGQNLVAMIRAAKTGKCRVLLVGMKLPPNYGPDYAQQFEQAFADVAREERVALLPFLLAPIALDQAAYQSDGLHPTADAQVKLLDHVWTALRPLLK